MADTKRLAAAAAAATVAETKQQHWKRCTPNWTPQRCMPRPHRASMRGCVARCAGGRGWARSQDNEGAVVAVLPPRAQQHNLARRAQPGGAG